MRAPSTGRLGLVCALAVVVAACGPSPEPRPETSPTVGVAVGVASPTEAPSAPAPKAEAKPDLYVVDPETGEATALLSAPGSQTNPEVSPDGERVVYESRTHGHPSQIFVLEADGTTRQLTHMKRRAFDPTWSPDGSQIAFAGTRPRDGDPRPDPDIFVMNADGSRIRRLAGTPRPEGHPDWSPDGSRVAFHSREPGEGLTRAGGRIWMVSVGTHTLTHPAPSASGGPWGATDPTWSPDGRWIVFTGSEATINGRLLETSLWLMRPNGHHRNRIRRSGSFIVLENPSWSPNGRSIVFERNDPPAVGVHWDGAMGDVGFIDVRTERTRWIVTDAPSYQPSWSSDGILVSLSPVAVESDSVAGGS